VIFVQVQVQFDPSSALNFVLSARDSFNDQLLTLEQFEPKTSAFLFCSEQSVLSEQLSAGLGSKLGYQPPDCKKPN
jgi:hypothetical protein